MIFTNRFKNKLRNEYFNYVLKKFKIIKYREIFMSITYLLYFSRALARPDLAIDFHISLSIINFHSSSSSHSQSCFSVSINVFDCLPLFRVPCFGVHRIKLCATSSGCLTQCPTSLIRLYFIISEIFGIPLYNLSLVNLSFHDMLEAILNNLV